MNQRYNCEKSFSRDLFKTPTSQHLTEHKYGAVFTPNEGTRGNTDFLMN